MSICHIQQAARTDVEDPAKEGRKEEVRGPRPKARPTKETKSEPQEGQGKTRVLPV